MVAKTQTLIRSWKWRSFVSYFLLFSGIILIVSGVVLYVAPSGRVAHSTDWHLLGLDKGQWEAVHTNVGYVSLVFGIVHLLINWKVLVNYLWNRTRKAYQLKGEVVVALALSVVVLLGSAWSWPIFSDVMDLGETFANSWEDTSSAAVNIEEHNVTTSDETLLDEAGTEDITASMTDAATNEDEHIEGEGGPPSSAGWGRFTVAEMCDQNDVPLEEGLARLAAQGIEAEADDRIRTLADSSGYSPAQVVEFLLGLESGTLEAE